MIIVGRKRERALLEKSYESSQSECIAIYGRRRVGKTYLVRNFFLGDGKDCVYFELVGQKQENGRVASAQHQLANFEYAWSKTFGEQIAKPSSWEKAFRLLKQKVDSLRMSSRKVVLFLDELPWLCTPNSRFFENLDQAWNACFEPAGNVKLVLCGSASTWMLKRLMHARAGLSRRVTLKMHVEPFTLRETAEYLEYKKFDLTHESVAELYMVFGGIPYYLNFLSPQKSVYQNIDDECFRRDGHLRDEYDMVFNSLFTNAEAYKRVVEVLASKRFGLTFDEIERRLRPRAKSPSGSVHQILTTLFECGFVSKRPPIFNERKGAIFAIADEFVLFHLTWMRGLPQTASHDGVFQQAIAGSQSFLSWQGFSFEALCLKHQSHVRRALGLHKISAVAGSFYAYGPDGKRASQIDLLFDRADRCITICEVKHSGRELDLTRTDLTDIARKKESLRAYIDTRRQPRRNILVAFVTLHGVKKNRYFEELAPEVVTLDDLFAEI